MAKAAAETFRASQGHSIDRVDLGLPPQTPP